MAWSDGVEPVVILLLFFITVGLGCCTLEMDLICSLDLEVVRSECFTVG